MKIVDDLRHDWPMATEIHKLESRLWRIVRNERLKVVLFTSSLRGEGKSTTVAYLSAALALHRDRKILAADFDFRRPTLNTFFDAEVRYGLSDVLAGDVSVTDAIAPTKLEGLDLLPPAPGDTTPNVLLNASSLANVLEPLRGAYDLVIIDSPPLIPVPDTAALIPIADGVVLAVMAGVTTAHHLNRARELCLGMGAKILGLVVGNVQEAAPEYLDTHYYAYGDRHNNVGRASTPKPTE